MAGPLAASLYFSFSDYDMLNPPEWSGLDNFRRMAEDSMFWRSLWNTLYFAVLFVPLQTFLALVLAVALNQRLKGLKWFRMAHFIPVISSWTVILYVADAVFNPRFGLANTRLPSWGWKGKAGRRTRSWRFRACLYRGLERDRLHYGHLSGGTSERSRGFV